MADRVTLFLDENAVSTEVFNQRVAQTNAAFAEQDQALGQLGEDISEVQDELMEQATQISALDAAKAGKPIMTIVTLAAAAWTEDATNGWWTQPVSNPAIVDGVKVDISFAAAQIKQLAEDGASIAIRNNAGTATAYAFGAAPSVDLTGQIEIREVTE